MFIKDAWEAPLDNFQPDPTPRLYMSRMLQWIEYGYRDAIKRKRDDIFDQTVYGTEMFEPSFKWHFTKPQLYKHGMTLTYKQLKELGKVEGKERYLRVDNLLNNAYNLYKDLSLDFELNSDGGHLPHWRNVLSLFAEKRKWK